MRNLRRTTEIAGRGAALIVIVALLPTLARTAAEDRGAGLASDAPRAKLVPAPGSAKDATTGLPTRVVHPASGVMLVLIPAGEFEMGSPPGEIDRGKDERRHRRVIRRAFYLGETEVTAGQFRKFARATGYQTDAERGEPEGDHRERGGFAATADGGREWTATASWHNPFPNLADHRPADDHPVVHVSWNDAQRFCAHFGLRLPSEAEWEYACRAGSAARFPWGESEADGKGRANVGDERLKKRFPRTSVPFPFDDGAAFVAPVGRYQANAWGLRDMIGNVEEWCQDAYAAYPADGADESAAQGGPASARVLRGGAWVGNPGTSRSAARVGMKPTSRRDFQGFRVAATVEAAK